MFRKPVTLAALVAIGSARLRGTRAERRLMQHVIDALAGASAVIERADVALDEGEPRPLRRLDQRLHFIEIALIAGREIVEPHHALIELEQRLQQIRADKAGDAGDQPGSRLLQAVAGETVRKRSSMASLTDARRRLRG